MKSFSSINLIGVVIVGIVAMFFIVKFIANNAEIPPMDDFMASSTEATSTDSNADSDVNGREGVKLDLNVLKKVDIMAPKGKMSVFVAQTTDELESGLSFQDRLPADRGMIFVFSTVSDYGFWMRDMKFPLDIVWIDKDKKIIGISSNLSPETYPTVFSPISPVLYVLEVNAGEAQKTGMATGTMLKFDL